MDCKLTLLILKLTLFCRGNVWCLVSDLCVIVKVIHSHLYHAMPQIQESCCTLNGFTSNLPIVCCIDCVTMAWYKIVVQHFV